MRSLVLFLIAAAIGAPAADAPSATARTRDFVVEPSGLVQPFTVECEPGEVLIGGGFSAAPAASPGSAELRVVSSYPNGGGWTVQVINPGKLAATLKAEAACLANSPGKSTIVETKGETPKAAAQCPQGTVATGGGYLTTTSLRTNGAIVNGSHPIGDNGWGIEAEPLVNDLSAAPGTRQIEVFAVCLESAQIASAQATQLQAGSFDGTCSAGEALSSLGYEVTGGHLGAYALQVDTSSQLTVNSRTPVSLRVTTLCLSWPQPVSAATNWPLIGGLGLVVLVVLVAAALAYRLRSRRTLSNVDVVVSSERGGFLTDLWREVP